MNISLPESAGSACATLAAVKQASVESGEVVKLILSGTRRIDSWLIEHHIVVPLQEHGATLLHFSLSPRGREERYALLLPLQDGGAFARSTSERWTVLECLEALSAIQYIGYRYASDNAWTAGFTALAQTGSEPPRPISPFEAADAWNQITGHRPAGFDPGALDEMESLGLKLVGRIFNIQGRLGL